MGAGNCLLFGKWGLGIPYTGIHWPKKNNRKLEWLYKIKVSARQLPWHLCTCTMGFSQNLGWEMRVGPLLPRPQSLFILVF